MAKEKMFLFCVWITGLLFCFQFCDAAVSESNAMINNVTISAGQSPLMPMAFALNAGQWPDSILFRTQSKEMAIWFKRNGFDCQEVKYSIKSTPHDKIHATGQYEIGNKQIANIETRMIDVSLVGANPAANVRGEKPVEYKTNYFLGNNPGKWRTDVINYESILLEDIYPGIDLRYYGNDGRMEYDFVLSPGADLSQIKIHFDGAKSAALSGSSQLAMETDWGCITSQILRSYQVVNGENREISCHYIKLENSTFGFQLDGPYDNSLPLVIDPVLFYSTYLGGSSLDQGLNIAVDMAGSAYVVGIALSLDFPTINPYDGSLGGGHDIFITKMNSLGSSLVFSTFLGGSAEEDGYDIFLDDFGNIYITGGTNSNDFPVVSAFDASYNDGIDAYVCKLNANGNSLIFSTYIGGSDYDRGQCLVVDGLSCAYLVTYTMSNNFPVVNAYDATYNGGVDITVTKIGGLGNSVLYSTYLGGSNDDDGVDITIDAGRNIYLTGYTQSANFPIANAYDASLGGVRDAFVTKLNSAGNGLVFSTYLGGSLYDYGMGITLDISQAIYITGTTSSSNFPIVNAFDATINGDGDIFVTKMNPAGTGIVYSTFIGGSYNETGKWLAVDDNGCAYVVGATNSTDFPVVNPYDASFNGFEDITIFKLNGSGNGLYYSTYLGGDGNDQTGAGSGGLDGTGCIYLSGFTTSANFPTANPYDGSLGGSYDAFVAKLCDVGACGDLSFRPNPEGWQFANTSNNMWPSSWWQQFNYTQPPYPSDWATFCKSSDFPDWPLFVAAFGESQCYIDPPPGTIVYNPTAVAMWRNTKGNWGGSCCGFAISSFLFFDQFINVATLFPGYSTVYSIPINDQSRMLINKYWVYINGRNQWDEILSNYKITTPNQTLQACQTMFNSPIRDHRILILYNQNGTAGHAVNPYRCEIDAVNSNIYYIYIYDNNHPGDNTKRVAINTTSNTWSYSDFPTWGGSFNLFLSGPMSGYTVPPIIRPSDGIDNQPHGEVKKEIADHVTIYFQSADTVLFHSSLGDIGKLGDSLFRTLLNAMPIVPITGQETPPIGYYLPNTVWHLGISGISDSTFRLTLLSDSTAIIYQRHNIPDPSTEEMIYGGNDSSIWLYNPDNDGVRNYDMEGIASSSDSEIVCSIRNLEIGSSDSIKCSITPGLGLKVDNYGSATGYNARVVIAAPGGEVVFLHYNLTLPGSCSHQLIPDWRQTEDSLMVLIDNGINGTIDDTLRISLTICGDANGDKIVNIKDITFVINYLYRNGGAPYPMQAADVNGDGSVNIKDITYLIKYLYQNGQAPHCP